MLCLILMSDLLPRLVKMLLRIWQGQSEMPSSCILGYEYERRGARRAAVWGFCVLGFLFLVGWVFFHWVIWSYSSKDKASVFRMGATRLELTRPNASYPG